MLVTSRSGHALQSRSVDSILERGGGDPTSKDSGVDTGAHARRRWWGGGQDEVADPSSPGPCPVATTSAPGHGDRTSTLQDRGDGALRAALRPVWCLRTGRKSGMMASRRGFEPLYSP